MGWILLAVAAAAVAGAAVALRGGRRAGRHSDAIVYPRRSRAERSERPHRHVAHYRASGALPRWDP